MHSEFDRNWKTNLKVSFIRTIRESSMHGLPKVFEEKRRIFKLMWAICFMVSLAWCSFFVYKEVDEYLQFSVITNINYKYENVAQFPTISFCSTNKVNFLFVTVSNNANHN